MAQTLSSAPAAIGDALSPKMTMENAMFATIKMENSICPSTVIPVLSTLIQWRRSLSTTSFQAQRSSLWEQLVVISNALFVRIGIFPKLLPCSMRRSKRSQETSRILLLIFKNQAMRLYLETHFLIDDL